MSTFYLENGGDTYTGTDADEWIYGGNGADVINGGGGNDTIYGGNGADMINGGGGNDTIDGGNGPDTITGGPGNDVMTGGGGGDTFVFNFTVTSQQQLVVLQFRDGNTPANPADAVAWTNYLKQLAAWRLALESEHGEDQDDSLDESVFLTTSTKKGSPSILLGEQTFDKDFSYMANVASATVQADGVDQIMDWGNGPDTLVFAGLSADSTALNYYGNFVTAAIVGANTVIDITGGDSITLVGVNTTLEALVAGGLITFC
jgi:hypothetical protein